MENQVNEPAWRKSSYSGNGGGNCVEVAEAGDLVLVRDSKDPKGPALSFTRTTWTDFVTATR